MKEHWTDRELSRFSPQVKVFRVSELLGDGASTLFGSTIDIKSPALYTEIPTSVKDLMAEYGFTPEFKHFIHIGIDDKSKIAYTATDKDGERDRQTVTSIGKYLKRVSSLDDPQIAKISNLYRKEVMGETELKFAVTREEIKFVYETGPDSCMGNTVDNFYTNGVHPCEVYATPDVKVAYITRTKGGEDKITARCVINVPRKEFGEIYGDSDTLEPLLRDQGYTAGDLYGCSLLLLKNSHGDIICPYIDGERGIDVYSDRLEVVADYEGEYMAEGTGGTVVTEEQWCCDCCDYSTTDEDELYFVEDSEEHVCLNCLDDYYFVYDRYPWEVYVSSYTDVYEYAGSYYTARGLESNNLVLADCGTVYKEDEVYESYDTNRVLSYEDLIYDEQTEEYYEHAYNIPQEEEDEDIQQTA